MISPELMERVLLHILLEGQRFVAATGGTSNLIEMRLSIVTSPRCVGPLGANMQFCSIILKELASAQIDLPQLDSKSSGFLAAGEKKENITASSRCFS
jgi:hypothetical protein